MDYFIGIDIGTSSARAIAFSADGTVLAKHAVSYFISHPKADWSEQDPNEISEAVINSIHKIAGLLAGHHPVLVSFSAAMHSIVAVDKDCQPLTKCIIWADNRAALIAENLRSTKLGKEFYHKTGVPVHAMSPLCKLIWWKENQPDTFTSSFKFIGIKEFIFYKLFKKYMVDTSIASATGLLNIHTRLWDEEILAFAGIKENRLSPVVSSQHIEYLKQGHTHDNRLSAFGKTAFVAGGSDGGLANLGSGAMAKGSMAITVGTSGAVRITTQEVYTDPQMRTFCYHLKDECYIIGGASNNGAVVLQWLKENILQDDDKIDTFINLAAEVDPGCNDLIFLPYILGERAPLWNSNAKGVFFGLSAIHGKVHLVRAAMEAVVYNLYKIGIILMERVTVNIIFANGGFVNNALWIQMLSDMFNVTVFVNGIEESSAWGAVIVGMEELDIEPGQSMAMNGVKYEPDIKNHRIYLKHFQKFEKIYELVESEFVSRSTQIPELAVSTG